MSPVRSALSSSSCTLSMQFCVDSKSCCFVAADSFRKLFIMLCTFWIERFFMSEARTMKKIIKDAQKSKTDTNSSSLISNPTLFQEDPAHLRIGRDDNIGFGRGLAMGFYQQGMHSDVLRTPYILLFAVPYV